MRKIYSSYLFITSLLILALCGMRSNAQGIKVTKDILPAIGTTSALGQISGITIAATVQSPSAEDTPLQIVCVFEYEEGDIYKSPPALPPALNGLVHIDHQLNGLITELRKSGKFKGHALETLLLSPPPGTIPAKKLLLIGLGKKTDFKPDLMVGVGSTGMREALRLGVSSYAHASDLKDGGLDSPTGLIATNVIQGAVEAYQTELFLKQKNYSSLTPVTKITLLAGPAFYAITAKAVSAYVKTLSN
ncbi:M17 family peptidase N-terminal domain-containing protein [Mucilaginibacter sp. NFX135]|uniref:M17 family peptidase N-terminal domain-containing protein n=1 Tax=Mucilaginibacter sp. NFX135 TaxID=3402687 RepID=UPI003AFA9525